MDESNKTAHHTDMYNTSELILRRGQSCRLTMEFNKPLRDWQSIVFIAHTGPKNSEQKGTHVEFALSSSWTSGMWSAVVESSPGNSLKVIMSSPANAVIGRYDLSVRITVMGQTATYSLGKFILLFNPWCLDDEVYMANEDERKEYVLNDHGVIFMGNEKHVTGMGWNFGQFENNIMNIALDILDRSLNCRKDPTADALKRYSPTYVGRVIAAMINGNDDFGVLEGKWSKDFADGVDPNSWNGSVEILRKWQNDDYKPVKYGQCWVFAAVMCTVLRCLGIPTRVITNFNSAHNTDGNMTIDMHYDSEGKFLELSDDSIWNFHVWNESWFKRSDLGHQYNGWQVLDSTPQEQSQGIYQCGPTSVVAVKEGDVHLGFDTHFVFSEVNADRVTWIVQRDGTKERAYNDSKYVGQHISTKAVGSDARVDITHSYKYPEGSPQERKIFEKASSNMPYNRTENINGDENNMRNKPITETPIPPSILNSPDASSPSTSRSMDRPLSPSPLSEGSPRSRSLGRPLSPSPLSEGLPRSRSPGRSLSPSPLPEPSPRSRSPGRPLSPSPLSESLPRSRSPSRSLSPSPLPEPSPRSRYPDRPLSPSPLSESSPRSRSPGRPLSPSPLRDLSLAPARPSGLPLSSSPLPDRSSSPSRSLGRPSSPSPLPDRSLSPSRSPGRPLSPSPFLDRSLSPSRSLGLPLFSSPLSGYPSSPSPLSGHPSTPLPLSGRPLSPSPLSGPPPSPSPLSGRPSTPSPLSGPPPSPSPLSGRPSTPLSLSGRPLSPSPLSAPPSSSSPLSGRPSTPLPLSGRPSSTSPFTDPPSTPLAFSGYPSSPLPYSVYPSQPSAGNMYRPLSPLSSRRSASPAPSSGYPSNSTPSRNEPSPSNSAAESNRIPVSPSFSSHSSRIPPSANDYRPASPTPSLPQPSSSGPDVAGKFKLLSPLVVGDNINLILILKNLTPYHRPVKVTLSASCVLYTGRRVNDIFTDQKALIISPSQDAHISLQIPYSQYQKFHSNGNMIQVVALCELPFGDKVVITKDLVLDSPRINIKPLSPALLNKLMTLEIRVTNPLDMAVTDCIVVVEGSGLVDKQLTAVVPYLKPKEKIKFKVELTPYRTGTRQLIANLKCKHFSIKGYRLINVEAW